MARTSAGFEAYRSLGALLLVMAVLAAGVITSCGGGGGGGSNGELCDQCGDDPDGPCQTTVLVDPNDPHAPSCSLPVITDPSTGQCRVALECRRKVDSGQRRCYPKLGFGQDSPVDAQFRCDGSRPGGTPGPAPTPTLSPSPGPTSTSICGNGVIESGEDCEAGNLNGESCTSLSCGIGSLGCSVNCKFNFSGCTGLNCTH